MLSTGTSATSGEATLDAVFSALGDATRRSILRQLARGPQRVTELAKPYEMSLPAVGKHLRVLEQAGLIRREVDGRVHNCSLDARPLRDAGEWIAQYSRFWEETLQALADHFGQAKF